MAVTADILRRLGKLRLEADAFEEVLAIIADVQAIEEVRRLQQRERVARHRALKRNGDVPVTLHGRDSNGHTDEPSAEEGQTSFSKSENYPPSPPKGGSVPPKKPRATKPPKPQGTLCPEDFRPNESHYLKCQQRQVPRAVADRAAGIIIDWSHTNAHRDIAWKSDWPRALHRVLDDEIEKAQRNAGRSPTPRGRPPPFGRTQDFWANEAIEGNDQLNGGRHDERPFDTDAGTWRRPGEPGHSGPDERDAQPAGADPRQLPPLRLVSRA